MESMWEAMLEMRGLTIERSCAACGGAGKRMYGDLHGWGGPAVEGRARVGEHRLTFDVCDHCWGSGDRYHAWPSHRRYMDMVRAMARAGTGDII
jgi:hypothetical protein